MDTTAAPGAGNIGQTLSMLQTAMRELATADYAELPAATLGEVLLVLERADAAGMVARGRALNAFDARDGHEDDGQKTAGAWLVNVARVTRAEAAGYRSWGRLVAAHPLIAAAMGEELPGGAPVMSRSRARKLCSITGRIPQPHRRQADEIIVTAARAGAALHDLVYLAAEILARTAPPDTDDKPFTDRGLRLETTLGGAGVLSGDLSPECTAAVQAVLGALSRRCGKDDHRSHGERLHDGLFEAMTRLLGSDLVPKKNGHPTQAIVHIGLADLLTLDDGSVLVQDWTARLAARWAGMRAAAAQGGGDGGAWICGPAARGLACDASLFPIVTGTPDIGAVDDLVKLCVQLDGYLHRDGGNDVPVPDRAGHAARIEELTRQIIGKAVALLSGEAGLASFLRRNLLGQMGLGGPSLPLDVGDVDDVPWWIRRAVHTRDQKCRFPTGCDQPAAATQPHHVTHRVDHGRTSLENIYDLCWFHHQVVVHRWGWTIKTRGDGTLEARSPGGKIHTDHTRPPPPQPG